MIKIAKYYNKILVKKFNYLTKCNFKILFYFHDKETFSRVPLYQEIDKEFRFYLYISSHCLIFAEKSAQNEIKKTYNLNREFHVSCLGSYKEYYGELCSKDLSRKKYGIPSNTTVILSIGTNRKNRNNKLIIKYIDNNFNDLYFLAGGTNHINYRSNNVFSINGYLSDTEFLSFLSCADYIVHSGFNYLTSSIVRVALSYNIPVIAESYGSTIDMCGSTLQVLPSNEFYLDAFFKNLPRRSSLEYKNLVKNIHSLNDSRSWSKAAFGFKSALDSCCK
jgi:hypothetical protein